MTQPRLARAILRWLTPRGLRASLLDDLDESFDRLAAMHGSRAARRWYWRQCLTGVGPAIQLRLRHRARVTRFMTLDSIWQDIRQSVRALKRSPGYFKAIGTRLQLGRDFDDRDALGAPPVAVISEGLARRLWPEDSPIGKRIAAHSPDKVGETLSWMEVVGVVDEVDPILHDRGESPFVYVPLAQQWQAFAPNLIVWGGDDVSALMLRVKNAVLGADASAQVYGVQTMGEIAGEILYPRRTAVWVLLIAGGVGLLVSAIGLYGVLSYSIAQRLREIGVRVALGADRRSIVALVLRDAAAVATIGTSIGIVLSVFALRITSTLVGPVPAVDAISLVGVPAIVALVILMACYLPARRATRVAPIDVLRGL